MKRIILAIVSVSLMSLLGAGCSSDYSNSSTTILNGSVDNTSLYNINYEDNIEQVACLHSSQVQYTNEETSRMQEIMKEVMANSTMPTTVVYNEFWSLMNKHGQICSADVDATKAAISGIMPCQKIFYGDALKSISILGPIISDELIECQKSARSLMTESKWINWVNGMTNDMKMIAKDAMYNRSAKMAAFKDSIKDIDAKLARLNSLFSSVAPIDNGSASSTGTKSDNDLACERDHGPSKYIKLSAGQGAYCDCLKGYASKPMKINGVNSSWCVKQ